MTKHYEAIVVGCGGLGFAALYWLSRGLGSSVPGIEQFGFGYEIPDPDGLMYRWPRFCLEGSERAIYIAVGGPSFAIAGKGGTG
ncbi:MAG: hypothetical protein ACFB50_06865 [Rubrobacteraceae bacterium]